MLDRTDKTQLLDIRQVCRSFAKGSGEERRVVEPPEERVRVEKKPHSEPSDERRLSSSAS